MTSALNFFINNHIPINWLTLQIGLELKLLNPEDIIAYAVEHLDKSPEIIRPLVLQLAIQYPMNNSTDFELQTIVDAIIAKLYSQETSSNEKNKEVRKWRLKALEDLNHEACGVRETLDKIAEIYATFDYQKDMDTIVYYMPTPESEHLSSNPEKKLYQKFIDFIASEKNKLKA